MKIKFFLYKTLFLLPNFLQPLKTIIIKKYMLGQCGSSTILSIDIQIIHPQNLIIGSDVYIGPGFYCSTIKKCVIGDRVMFGPRCMIIGGDHAYNNPEENMRFLKAKGIDNDIYIESDSWIGANTTLLKNTFVSEGTIIGANSIVNLKLKPYCVYAGNPAKLIKPRFDSIVELENYLKMMYDKYGFYSKYSMNELRKIYE